MAKILVVDDSSTVRDEVAAIRDQMVTKITFEAATTAIRGDIEQVQLRLDSMEHSFASRFEHVEGELSVFAVLSIS